MRKPFTPLIGIEHYNATKVRLDELEELLKRLIEDEDVDYTVTKAQNYFNKHSRAVSAAK